MIKSNKECAFGWYISNAMEMISVFEAMTYLAILIVIALSEAYDGMEITKLNQDGTSD